MRLLALIYFVVASIACLAQSTSETKEFRPSLSPIILAKNQFEIGTALYLGFYKLTESINGHDSKYRLTGNASQVTFGVASFLNIGADFGYLRATKTVQEDGEDFQVTYWSTTIGPRIRWSPLRYDKNKRFSLTFQHSVLFPLKSSLNDRTGNSYVAIDRQLKEPSYYNQLVFMHGLGTKVIFLAQTDLGILPKGEADLLRPISSTSFIYVSWLASTRLMFFILSNYAMKLGSVPWASDPNRYYSLSSSVGLGPGIQLGTVRFTWSLSYLHPLVTKDIMDQSLAVKTFNTSFRWKLGN